MRITLHGRLDSQRTGTLVRQTRAALSEQADLIVDATGVAYCDVTGAAYLLDLRQRQDAAGRKLEIVGLKAEFARLLDLFDAGALQKAETTAAARPPLVERVGRETMAAVRDAAGMLSFLGEVTVSCVRSLLRRQKIRWSDAFLVADAAGTRALPVIALMGLILGLIVAFQGAIPLKRYGGEVLVADMVILAMFREMGPLFTAIILAARSSSAFAAELGTMKINEEVDALKTMGLDPVPFLVMPRILAGVLVAPLLTVVTNVMGLVGGGVVFLFMGFTPVTYMERLLLRGSAKDFAGGLFRALVFGVLIAGIGCLQGLRTGRGARAVGTSTTGAVVSSIVAIILADGLLAVVYYKLGHLMGEANSTEVVIQVENLSAGYGETAILEGVSFDVMEGEILVILGGSGAGKTTVLKHMIGLNPPLAGSIRIYGQDLVTVDETSRKLLMRRFGVMYQMGALFGSMTLLENVRLPLEEFTDLPADTMDLIALMKLDLVGLKDAAWLMPAEISGGMQKRAAIARAMALDPGILFLDEPSAGLDPITAVELDQLILQLNRTLGITFVVVSHELPSIFTIARRVIMLDKETRGIIAEGDPHELAKNDQHPWVRRFFSREAEPHPGKETP